MNFLGEDYNEESLAALFGELGITKTRCVSKIIEESGGQILDAVLKSVEGVTSFGKPFKPSLFASQDMDFDHEAPLMLGKMLGIFNDAHSSPGASFGRIRFVELNDKCRRVIDLSPPSSSCVILWLLIKA